MKNIHLLPTDNYSPLVHSTNKYGGYFKSEHYSPMKEMGDSYQHIYITSDEEIKAGDWYYLPRTNLVYECTEDPTELNLERSLGVRKIILTTDPDLIKDGVQPIDDKFLEWFVKNPSCESVDVKHFGTCCSNQLIAQCINCKQYNPVYKIIIPKEEPEQETVGRQFYKTADMVISVIRNKETLEEAAETWNEHQTTLEFGKPHNAPNRIKAFIAGAKWQQEHYGLMEIELSHTKTLLASCEKALEERDKQQERMYSEEEVFNLCREFAIFVQRKGPSYKKQQEWFEQFKKK